MPMPFDEMAGVFDIELHDVDETVEVDSEDDAIQVEEVCVEFVTKFLSTLSLSVEMKFQCRLLSWGRTNIFQLGWDWDFILVSGSNVTYSFTFSGWIRSES